MVTVAMAQMYVEPGAKAENLARIRRTVAAAASQGADIVVLPEAADLGWTHPSARTLAEEVPDGDSAALYRELARNHEIYVCGGLVERAGSQLFNSALLVDPSGDVLIHHRKINELDIANGLYSVGDRLRVAETPFGRVGVMICADAMAPGDAVARVLGRMEARIILSPCAWAVPADHDNRTHPYGDEWRDHYGRVAREFGLWVVGVSNVGPVTAGAWAGRRCIGSSLLVGPNGTPVAQGPYGEDAEALIRVEIDPRRN